MNNANSHPTNSGNQTGALPDHPRPGNRVKPVPLPATSVLNAKPTVWTLLLALRKRLLLSLVIGLVVGLAVSGTVWFVVPDAKHSVSAKLWLKEIPPHFFFPNQKEPNFGMFQRTQVAFIKSRHVLTSALDQEEVKKLKVIRESMDGVTYLEKKINVDFKDSPEIAGISLEGDQPEELKVIVDAIVTAYLYHFVKEEERSKEQRKKGLRELLYDYDQRILNKRKEWQDFTEGIGASDLDGLHLNQQVALMLKTMAEKELSSIRYQKIKLNTSLLLEQRKYLKDYALTVSVFSTPPTSLPTTLAAVNLLEICDLHKTKVVQAPKINPVYQKDGLLADFLKRKADLEYKIRGTSALSPKFREEKLKEFEKELEKTQSDIMERQQELDRESGEKNSQQFVSEFAYLTHQWNAVTKLEEALEKEVKQVGEYLAEQNKASLPMKTIQMDLEDLEKTRKGVKGAIEALEVEKNADPRVVSLQKAVIYPPPTIGRKEMMTVMGGLGSLALILAGFAFLEFRARRIGSGEEVIQNLGLNFIGSVPDYAYRPRRLLKNKTEANLIQDRLLMDSIDAARTMLMSHAKDEKLQVVMVTSSLMGEGKTSASGHLAASLARSGQKALLVDCDLRNPNVHRLFGTEVKPGLSEVLRGECDIKEAIQPSFTEGLSLLPSGSFNKQSLPFFSETNLTRIIQALRSQYDFIILDSSPVSIVPESQTLCQCADGVILALMRNVSRLHKVHSTYELLHKLGGRVLGFIMNGVRENQHAYSSYYYLPVDKE